MKQGQSMELGPGIARIGLPPVAGSGHPVGGGVRAADDRTGTILPGETASTITVLRMWGGHEVGVAGSPPTYAALEGNGRDTASGDHAPRQRATYL